MDETRKCKSDERENPPPPVEDPTNRLDQCSLPGITRQPADRTLRLPHCNLPSSAGAFPSLRRNAKSCLLLEVWPDFAVPRNIGAQKMLCQQGKSPKSREKTDLSTMWIEIGQVL